MENFDFESVAIRKWRGFWGNDVELPILAQGGRDDNLDADDLYIMQRMLNNLKIIVHKLGDNITITKEDFAIINQVDLLEDVNINTGIITLRLERKTDASKNN